ncbi:hypothetical protein BK703_30700 [Bacillus thuringiensis serovar silo]|uniref:hypothetical protein n=1 Tax=Bacillus cereus group TaxID=86661 RepID=UPI000A3C86A5|nr:hypothetical protein [Bacillus thuringiensis]MEB8858738.1 hypothetical protein [Bacillus cereus]MEC2466223.1 hypothetical protein [Bacillus cereus]MRC87629.1 hypothetical protein [Bacillus thuringiensis]OTW47651.1 hypothetical protein BK703_30700 [Bacillus thuringiensis serovar silo]OTW66812.1 hypothetical protein BK700_09570 [Bacillus thuringiensis serovar toguchini]
MSIVNRKKSEAEKRGKKSKKYERIFIISFLMTIFFIIGSVVTVGYTGFKYIEYLAVVIITGIAITNDAQKAYKKSRILSAENIE